MNLLSTFLLLAGVVIPRPNNVETSEKVFDKAHLENVVYKSVEEMPQEAYELQITGRKVVIKSSSAAGRFYAEKTLEQLSTADVMHCATIKDAPRFEWRGFMLDESRHFFGKEKVKQLLDMMARYKLNRFHWHLTDSQGWRIEIKAYPQLCEVGAVGCYSDAQAPAQYYTQDDIREIVEYAAQRHIEVIPEIDMPGHARAAARAIPQIDGTRGTFNPGIEETYKVLGTVIKELAGLFPGRYIHIGGDEVNTKAWLELPEVKALMSRENFDTMAQVQGYFTRRMADTVSFYGKQMVGWDEVLDTGTPSNGKVLHWWRARSPESLKRGIEKGFKMVVCPNRPFYLDYVQSETEKVGRNKYINTLQDIYEFRIDDHPQLIGAQSNLWTERVGDGTRIDYMIFPRLLALAELAWTRTENMDYQDFLERVNKEYDYMDSIGLYYFDMRNPSAHPESPGPVKRCSSTPPESMKDMTARVFDRAAVQFELLDRELDSLACLESNGMVHPRSLKSDGSLWTSNRNWWCSGYFPGSLWMLYGYSGDEHFKNMALKYQKDLEPLRFRTKDHDVGVQLMCSYGNCLCLTDNQECVPVILDGAKSLATRFDSKVGCTRSWSHGKWTFPVIIDNMMNLELLLRAAELGGDDSLKDMALTHARTTMKNHFRDDNSCFHLVDYDPNTGDVIGKQTVQGYADDSAWARGQAWALYGYTMMYRFTKEQDMLDQAVMVADYIIPRLPEDFVPYWDFDSPAIPDDVRDASSASIMASAFIELSGYVDAKKSARYLWVAEKMLRSLASDNYLMPEGEGHGFLLKHSTGNKNKNYEVDAPLTYADYYFLEALLRWNRLNQTKRQERPDMLSADFAGTPPKTAYPWVWWHWIDGNISKEGIRKDLLWMHEIGIAGLHHFDAGKAGVRQIVPQKLTFMSEKWKDAFRYAMSLTDSLGIEVGIASSPGWSSTGGPWVKPEDAMKKLVWRTMEVTGGDKTVRLPEPFNTVGFYQDMGRPKDVEPWYRDIAVVAVRIPKKDHSLHELGAEVSSSEGAFSLDMLTDGVLKTCSAVSPNESTTDAWIQYTFPRPQTFKAVTVAGEALRQEWDRKSAPSHLILECSQDNVNFQEVTRIPDSFVYTKTIDFPAVSARYWRLRILPSKVEKYHVREFVLHAVVKVNNVDKKAGFAAHYDFMQFPTPDSPNPIREVLVLGLPDENGMLHVNLPKGNWRIYRFGQSLTGKKNHPAAKHATGLEVDKLDPDAWMAHFRKYLDMYKEASGNMVGQRGVQYILTDSYEARQMTWTKNMAEEFVARNGYDLMRWLPALTGEVIDSSEATEKFLWDWRNTIGDLFAENYDRINGIVKEYGMKGRYTESQGGGRTFVGDGMDVKMTAAFPMAEIWLREEEQLQHNLSDIRESASVAHIFGQNIVPVEAFTVNGAQNGGQAYKFCPENMKSVADLAMQHGVNRFVIHSSVHQPSDDKVPGTGLFQFGQWFNRHETWADMARVWMDYLARSSYMLQQGTFVADILYYYGEDNCITGLYRTADRLPDTPLGHDFDYINPKGLLQAVRVENDRLVTETGMSYEVLCLGENCRRMSLKVLRHIVSLAESGATVCGVVPQEPAGMNDDNKTFRELRDRLQKYIKPGSISEVLAAKGVRPDFSASEKDIRYVHRRLPAMDIYWVRNFSGENVVVDLGMRTPGAKIVEVWNPENGKQYSIPFELSGDGVWARLAMSDECALFIVIKYDGVPAPQCPESLDKSIKLSGPWTVSFQQGRGAPESVKLGELADWTASQDDGIRYFSGTADYTTTLHLDEEIRDNAVLSLTDVKNLARVRVNGRDCGVVWKSPFAVDIPAGVLKAGDNTVTITVANLWVNRIIGDLQPGAEQRFTETPRDFYKADSPLLPSGLLGPVELKY